MWLVVKVGKKGAEVVGQRETKEDAQMLEASVRLRKDEIVYSAKAITLRKRLEADDIAA
jgi:hypothetical protein